jgi:hypothetical protein
MWRFYWTTLKTIPESARAAWHIIESTLAAIGLVIVFWCPEVAKRLVHWEQFDPRWLSAAFFAMLAYRFLAEVYRNHREQLRMQYGRSFWAFENAGGFYRLDERAWTEASSDRKLTYHFVEVACTREYIEIFDASRSCAVRLRSGQADIKQGNGIWTKYREGDWIAPINPILATPKADFTVGIDWNRGAHLKKQTSGKGVLIGSAKNTGDKAVVVQSAAFGVQGSDETFPGLTFWEQPAPDEIRPGHAWDFYVDLEELAPALARYGVHGTVKLEAVCIDALSHAHRSEPVEFDLQQFLVNGICNIRRFG